MKKISNFEIDELKERNQIFWEVNILQKKLNKMKIAIKPLCRFVPFEIIRTLLVSEVGVIRRKVTVLFTDIVGFNTLTKTKTAEELW